MKGKSKSEVEVISVKESVRELEENYPVTLKSEPLVQFYFPPKNQIIQEFSDPKELRDQMDIMLRNINQSVKDPLEKIEKTFVTKYLPQDAKGPPMEVQLKCKIRFCNAFIRYVVKQNGPYTLAEAQVRHKHRRRRSIRGRMPSRRNEEIGEYHDQLMLLNYKPREILDCVKQKYQISRPYYYSIRLCRNKPDGFNKIKQVLCKYDDFYLAQKSDEELLQMYKDKNHNSLDRAVKLMSQISRRDERGLSQKREENPGTKHEVLPEGDGKNPRPPKDKDIYILISKKMKDNYKLYHKKYIILSIFPKMVLQTRYHRHLRYHHMGVLYGEDCYGNLNLIFGMIFFRRRTKICYRYILEKTFRFLEEYSQILLTDYDPPLSEAVQGLIGRRRLVATNNNFKMHIVLPASFTSIFQDRHSVPFNSLLNTELPILLTEIDRQKYNTRLNRIINCAKEMNDKRNLDGIYAQLLPYIKKHSFLELPECFIGLCMTEQSVVSRLKTMVLDYFKSPRPLLLAIKAIFTIFGIYEMIRNIPQEQVHRRINNTKSSQLQAQKLNQLKWASRFMNRSIVFRDVVKRICPSVSLILQDALENCLFEDVEFVKDKGYYELEDLSKFQYPNAKDNSYYRIESKGRIYPYVIKKVLNTQCTSDMRSESNLPQYIWRCECNYYEKTGIPCWHELKICLLEKSPLIHQINPFWIIKAELKRTMRKREEPSQQQPKFNIQEQHKPMTKSYIPPISPPPQISSPPISTIRKPQRDPDISSLVEELKGFDFEPDPLDFSSVSDGIPDNGDDQDMSAESFESQNEQKQDGFEVAEDRAMQSQMPLQQLQEIYNSDGSSVKGEL